LKTVERMGRNPCLDLAVAAYSAALSEENTRLLGLETSRAAHLHAHLRVTSIQFSKVETLAGVRSPFRTAQARRLV